jgi:hypothetical protein
MLPTVNSVSDIATQLLEMCHCRESKKMAGLFVMLDGCVLENTALEFILLMLLR